MQRWQESYLGLRELPRELSEFELQAFFTFSSTERACIQRRRGPAMKLGLALHMGFVRMSGRPLDAFRVLPVVLLRHLGKELGIPVPDIASLRALYARGRTLSDHQELACRWLGFSWMTPHQRGALVRVLRDEVVGCADREQLLAHARRWLYEHRLLIVHDRALRALVAAASRELEVETAATIRTTVPPAMWQRWLATTTETRPDGQTTQNWLWAAPAKHSTRQINEVRERIELLVELGVDRVLVDLNAALVRRGVDALAAAARDGTLRVDDELHLAPLPAEEESPEVETLRAQLDHRIGEVQLPEAILAVDAQVHFSWIMLGREPRSVAELLMTYAGILAHGTSLTAAECARMIPELSANSIRQAMRWAADERRLRSACQAVLEFMQSHPIAASWGRADLASSDMMSLETSKRVWQARLDPRRQTASVGVYSHVRDRWGIFHAQPIVLNERQAGAALEGVVRQERLETTQLAVDTHGYTDFGMALARLLGFDLCPRLRALAQRRLFLPRGATVPKELAHVCSPHVDTTAIETHWDSLVHLAASVMSGHASAVTALARLGSAARGDPLHDAGVQLGRLLRTAFLADYFINEAFRRELRRALNRGEAVNALKRAIYSGQVAPMQARRNDEMQAVADALSLLANIIMAWNTSQMQAVLDHWPRRHHLVPSELIGRIAPTRLEGINLRGVFRFPVERYVAQLLPSQTAPKTRATR